MRRILLLTHEFAPFRGGIGRVAEGLAEGAARSGLAPTVYAPSYGEDTAAADRAKPYRVIRFDGDFCPIVSQRRLARFARLCDGVIRREEPDLVHAVDPAAQMATTALSYLGRLRRPWAFTVHGTELLRYRGEWIPRLWMARAFRRVGAVTLVSRAVRERLHRDFTAPRSRTFVSYPGIDGLWHGPDSGRRGLVRERWGADPADVVVLTVARRVREKGHDRVIEALATEPEELRRRVLYVVVGGGPDDYARDLESRARKGSVRLHLAGEIPDAALLEAYDAADVFVMLSRRTPTRLEGFGLTYVEAGARGLPSLACDTGGVREAVVDRETGILLPGNPTRDLVARELGRLIRDGSLRNRLGEAGRARAGSFTHERHASEVYGRFATLIGS